MPDARSVLFSLLASGMFLVGTPAAAFAQKPVAGEPVTASAPTGAAAAVRAIFDASCFECHGGRKTYAGIKILDRDLLVKKGKVIPGKPAESLLFQKVSDRGSDRMPPPERKGLSAAQIETIKRWIVEGAPPLPAETTAVAVDPNVQEKAPLDAQFVLQRIWEDARQLPLEKRRTARYFSLVHLLNAGISKDELNQHRDALVKAINHLSWKPAVVIPTPTDPTHLIYRIDLRELGWDQQPYRKVTAEGKLGERSPLNLWDLVLLEYPYGIIYEKSDNYTSVMKDFLIPANQVRPVPFVRGDWFVGVATQPPLYHELLELPPTLPELEKLLAVDAATDVKTFRAVRSGLVESGVSRNNRVVERHPMAFGAYWKSFDYKTSLGQQNLFTDPVNLSPDGGEMIFNLPNGLQAYFIVNAKGKRVDFAPTEIVVDSNASDKIVRDGLACMRCHENGMRGFKDVVHPTVAKLSNGGNKFDRREVLRLYPEQTEMDRLLKTDEDRFLAAMSKALGRPQVSDALKGVSTRFLDDRVTLDIASAELGLPRSRGLKEIFGLPGFLNEGVGGLTGDAKIPRDAWEVYYDRMVRQLGLGVPVVPLDGLGRGDYQPTAEPPFALEVKSNKKPGETFAPKEEVTIFVKASKNVHIEVIWTGAAGSKEVLVPSTTLLKAQQQFQFPAKGGKLTIPNALGEVRLTVFASEEPFPGGEVLRGKVATDRVVHRFPVQVKGDKIELGVAPDPVKTIKKTIALEVR
jgi:mono/diheme cytochrome c family protein